MARLTASDVLVETLIDWGVDTIFGIPGDGINGVIEALRTRQDRIRFIQVRHEESAAFAACAYAKWTGKLGVCLATSGPGGIHLLNGLYDAKLDGQPVLAITGLQFHDLVHTFTQQDVELDKLFADVAAYNVRIMGPNHVGNVVELACRTALACRRVAHVSDVMAAPAQMPGEDQIARAAAILNSGKKTAILAGRGALGAREVLEAVAERLGAPVVKPLLGKGALPDDSPYSTGGIGLLGTLPSQEALEECDTLLIAGSAFPYIEYYPRPGQARAVQIDLDPQRIGLRHSIEAGLVGDARKVLEALLPRLQHRDDRSFLAKAQAGMKEWNALMVERGTRPDKPMKPQVVAHELDKLLRHDAIVATDSGTITTWAARHLTMRDGMMFSCSGNLASMVFLGNPEYVCELQPVDFATVARGFGVAGWSVDDPARCGEVLREALAAPGPALVEAVVDPHEPPMPAKATLKQAAHLAEALARGTPARRKIALTVASDTVRELV
jgi:pyruvate dehydrogenase (quinone)/pyruvate oxidase